MGARSADAAAGPIASLLSASCAIASAQNKAALLDALAASMASWNVDAATLSRAHGGPEPYMEVVAAWDRLGPPAIPVGYRSPLPASASIDQLEPGRPLIQGEVGDHGGLDEHSKRTVEALGARSLLVFPLAQQGELLGLLSIFYRTPQAITPEQAQVCAVLAQSVSIALVNMESRTQLAERFKQLTALYRVGKAISEMADMDALIKTAADLLVSEIGYLNCWIGLVDEEAHGLRQHALTGLGAYPGRPPNFHSLDDHSVTAVAALHYGQLVVYDDIQQRAEEEGWGDVARSSGIRCAAYAQLRGEGKIIGVLAIGSTSERISTDELSLLGGFGNLLASTILRVRMSGELERQLSALEEAYARQARLLETVRALSTPVIPVHDGILVLPLVGMIDTPRSAQVMESLLGAIQRDRASFVIIDVTGVPAVDTAVADHLLRSARATALLGARCVLVGVSPAVAQTLVALGVDLGALETRSNLQAGISYALGQLDRGGSGLGARS
jgi:anti-anti-sigma regulatory factor/transcriptional regulator with GAF, ATPase, and Fis domain